MPPIIGVALVAIVAALHLGIAGIEMFLWPRLKKVHGDLRMSEDGALQATPIVANAGLYNGFLAAGLIWGLFAPVGGHWIATFFLACVVVAGLVGAATLSRMTLLLQSLPGSLALLAVWLSRAY